MASAIPSPLASSDEKTNGAKLSRLLIDGGTTVLRKIFDRYHPPKDLPTALYRNRGFLHNLLEKRVLCKDEWRLLFPPSGAFPSSEKFDITLLFLLLTEICGLSPPGGNWHSKPPLEDDRLEANLARIKFYRNTVYSHVSTTGVADSDFPTLWQEISTVLVALGLPQTEINILKKEPGEKEYVNALLKWGNSEKSIKSQLKNIRDINTKVLQTVERNESTLNKVHQLQKKLVQSQQQGNLNNERESIINDKVLAKLAKVDGNVNCIARHASSYVEGTRLSIIEGVKSWLADESSPNRVIVISGNAGMGKSVISAVLCQKMVEFVRLAGSHFCEHDKVRQRNPKVMLQSLACQLSESLPEYKKAIVKKLSRNVGVEIGDMEVEELFEFLFEEPLSVLKDPGSIHLMVIDGLDESEYQGRNELLNVIVNFFKKLPCWIRFVVTTRPEMNISEKIQDLNPIQLNPNDQENLKDIRLCFKKHLERFLQSDCQDTILEKLVEKSEGVMLYTYCLTEFIEKNAARMSVAEVINSDLTSGISSVYEGYFDRLKKELQEELGITEKQFFDFLNAIVAAREPLPVEFVYKLFLSKEWSSTGRQKVRDAVDCISALLPIEGECINFFHKSVKDWLVKESTSRQKKFNVSGKECHRVIAELCRDELDELKLKGIQSSTLKQTSRYALQHGVQHILEVEENARPCSLDDIVKNYVLDLELVYAKLTVKSTAATEDVLCVQEKENTNALSESCRKALKTLLLLLRKHLSTLSKIPHAIFQILLNEGEPKLSEEASILLNTKYAHLPYMEYVRKKEERPDFIMQFFASESVVCFDVSPNQDLLVCECVDGTTHLWSLGNAQLMWKRLSLEPKIDWEDRWYTESLVYPFSRSVVFHPTSDLILQRTLRQGYTFAGDVEPLFPLSECRFKACSISGDKTTMLTDCLDGRNCVFQWSLKDGSEISRFTHKCDILSFAWSRCGRRMAIADSNHCVYLIDMSDRFGFLMNVSTPSQCVQLTPDCRFLFGLVWDWDGVKFDWLRFPKVFCLDIDRKTESIYSSEYFSRTSPYQCASEFETCHESGFLSGDPFWFSRNGFCPSVDFALVLNKQMLLRVSRHKNLIEMCSLNDVRAWRGESSDEAGQSIELGDITTKRAENNDLTERNLLVINGMPEQKAEIDVLSGQRAEVADPSEERAELGGLVEQTMKRNNSTEERDELDDFVGERSEFNDPPEKRLKLDEPSERMELDLCRLPENGADPYSTEDDQEQQEPLFEDSEDREEISPAEIRDIERQETVYFSVDGDYLYALMALSIYRKNLETGGFFCKRFNTKAISNRRGIPFLLVPVKRGVLFLTTNGSLELWNSELSVRIQRWTAFFVRNLVPLSEERVALETVNGDDYKREVLILDITNERRVSTITNFDGKFLACNNKLEVLTITDGMLLQLWCENRVLWKVPFQFDVRCCRQVATFSPTEEYVVGVSKTGSCVLDAVSGKVIFQLKFLDVRNIKFISNECCIVDFIDSRCFFLRLYNVISGDLLSEIVEKELVQGFAVHPCKRLVAIALLSPEDPFEIIQVKLPGDKEKTNTKRLNLPE